jgi:hypothetical protein
MRKSAGKTDPDIMAGYTTQTLMPPQKTRSLTKISIGSSGPLSQPRSPFLLFR